MCAWIGATFTRVNNPRLRAESRHASGINPLCNEIIFRDQLILGDLVIGDADRGPSASAEGHEQTEVAKKSQCGCGPGTEATAESPTENVARIPSDGLRRIVFERCTFGGSLTLQNLRLEELQLRQCVFRDESPEKSENWSAKDLAIVRCDIEKRVEITTDMATYRHDRDGEKSAATESLRPAGGREEPRARLARSIEVQNSTFADGALIVVWAEAVDLHGARFQGDSLLQRGVPPEDANTAESVPLTSLSNAEVEHLWITDMDLRWCSMRGARGLDRVTFLSCRWPNARPDHTFRVPRRIVYDEVRWRMRGIEDDRSWFPSMTWKDRHLVGPPPVPGRARAASKVEERSKVAVPDASGDERSEDGTLTLTAWEVQDEYLALYRSQTHAGNHAPAADFMWGAYTMRRLAGQELVPARPPEEPFFRAGQTSQLQLKRHRAGWGDRLLVRAYRIFGGYGLRARWPLAWFVACIVATHGLVHINGYGRQASYADERARVSTTVAAMFPGSRTPSELFPTERVVVTTGRSAGIVFLGFALFAMRSRVRR